MAAAQAAGHAPGAVIQLGAERIQPGGSVTVHGGGMFPDETIVFELGDATKALTLGSAPATGDGEVDTVLTIPPTTPVGEWEVYARGPDGGAVSTHLTVAGPPVDAGEECDQLERGEICPTLPPTPAATAPAASSSGATSVPAPTSATVAAAPAASFHPRTLPPVPQDAPTSAPTADATLLWVVAAVGGVTVMVLLAVAFAARRRAKRTV